MLTSALNVLAAASIVVGSGCSGDSTETPDTPPVERGKSKSKSKSEVDAPRKARPAGKLPTLLMVQAQFVTEGGKPKPGPGKMTLWSTDGTDWFDEVIEDPESNVFHKAMPFEGGILTIAGEKAMVRHWKKGDGGWTPHTLVEGDWGGKFNRYRDVELADLDGDGDDEMALATHDQGWVVVGDKVDGKWAFTEMDDKVDTFVHEIEVGDVDGDGKQEFYATPSDRNRSSGESQPGVVVRYDKAGDTYRRTEVVTFEHSHAKEILVADLGSGDQLFVVMEAHTRKDEATGKVEIVDPVRILRLDPPGKGKAKAKAAEAAWTTTEVARLEDRQCRFLAAGNVDGDDAVELVAAGMNSGLWALQPKPDGTFAAELIDANSGGFEHATHLADLDGDGENEVYVAADKQGEFRRYTWTGDGFARKRIAPIPKGHITWNLQDASL